MKTEEKKHPSAQIRDYVIKHQHIGNFSEREIASRLKVSRSQVREVLLSLEGIGILRRRPQSGYSYVDFSSTSLMVARYFRYLVEHEAMRLVAGRIGEEEFRQLEEVLGAMDNASQARDFLRFSELDEKFHSTLVGLSRDPMLIHLFSYLRMITFSRERSDELRFESHGEYYAYTQDIHHTIFQALRKGNAKELYMRMNHHLGAAIDWQWIDGWLHGFTSPAGSMASPKRGRPSFWTQEQIQRARDNTRGLDLHSPQVTGLVIQLRACHNLTGDEVAAMLGVSPSAIDNLVHAFRVSLPETTSVIVSRGRGHRLLSDEKAQGLLMALGQREGGLPLAELRQALERHLGQPLRANYLYKLLARLGWRRADGGARGANWLPPTN